MEPLAPTPSPRQLANLLISTQREADVYQPHGRVTTNTMQKRLQMPPRTLPADRAHLSYGKSHSRAKDLWMIGFVAKQRVQERLAGGFLTTAMWLYGDKHRVDFRQLLGIIKSHDPATIGFVIHVEDAQIHR